MVIKGKKRIFRLQYKDGSGPFRGTNWSKTDIGGCLRQHNTPHMMRLNVADVQFQLEAEDVYFGWSTRALMKRYIDFNLIYGNIEDVFEEWDRAGLRVVEILVDRYFECPDGQAMFPDDGKVVYTHKVKTFFRDMYEKWSNK